MQKLDKVAETNKKNIEACEMPLKESREAEQTRREFFQDSLKKSVIIGIPLILTLKNRTVFAQDCNASGNLSGNLSGQ
jgi:hypothetical protein